MKPSWAPSTGLPCASRSSTCRTFSPARGGSGSSDRCTSMSPAWSASASSFLWAQPASSTRTRLAMLFMSTLRGLLGAEIDSDRPLQLGEALLVHGEMGRQLQLVHAQLAGAVDHHGEVGAAGAVARLRALHRLARDGDELVVQLDLPLLRLQVRVVFRDLRGDPVAQRVLRFLRGDDLRGGAGDARTVLRAAEEGQIDLEAGEEEIRDAHRIAEAVHLPGKEAQIGNLRRAGEPLLRL